MATGHNIDTLDAELDRLRGTICEMGGLAETAISDAMRALVRRDHEAAALVVERDRKIDALEAEIERDAVQIMAVRAPMADDLREVVAALKIAGVVERSATMPRISPSACRASRTAPSRPVAASRNGAAGERDAAHVLDAFAQRDPKKAEAVCERDAAVDDFYNSIFRTLLTHMMENPHNITPATHLLFVAKNLERIGDHATNVAEMVYFAATGEHLGDRAKGKDTASIGAGDLGSARADD